MHTLNRAREGNYVNICRSSLLSKLPCLFPPSFTKPRFSRGGQETILLGQRIRERTEKEVEVYHDAFKTSYRNFLVSLVATTVAAILSMDHDIGSKVDMTTSRRITGYALCEGPTNTNQNQGFQNRLTLKQLEALSEFKSKAKAEHLQEAKFTVESIDSVSLRFLQARHFSVTNALQLLDLCISKKNAAAEESGYCRKAGNRASTLAGGPSVAFGANIDTGVGTVSTPSTAEECLLGCDPSALKKWYPHGILGLDKCGRPIVFEASGQVNVGAVLQMTTLRRLVAYHWWSMEVALDNAFSQAAAARKTKYHRQDIKMQGHRSKNTSIQEEEEKKENDMEHQSEGESAEQHPPLPPLHLSTCALLDLRGMNFTHVTSAMMAHMQGLIALDNCCFPELLGKMLIINAPWLATSTWPLIRQWLSERTQSKIEIMGAASSPEVQRRLLQEIDARVLPQCYGGTAPDPADPVQAMQLESAAQFVHVPAGKHVVCTVELPRTDSSSSDDSNSRENNNGKDDSNCGSSIRGRSEGGTTILSETGYSLRSSRGTTRRGTTRRGTTRRGITNSGCGDAYLVVDAYVTTGCFTLEVYAQASPQQTEQSIQLLWSQPLERKLAYKAADSQNPSNSASSADLAPLRTCVHLPVGGDGSSVNAPTQQGVCEKAAINAITAAASSGDADHFIIVLKNNDTYYTHPLVYNAFLTRR